LKEIRWQAFSPSSLQSIVIPSSVEFICRESFSDCKSLSSVLFELSSSLKTIGSAAFSGSSLHSIVLPRQVEEIDGDAFTPTPLKSLLIEPGNVFFQVHDHFVLDVLGNELKFGFNLLSQVVVPKFVKVLGRECFYSCESV
jgi:hypothetical protein